MSRHRRPSARRPVSRRALTARLLLAAALFASSAGVVTALTADEPVLAAVAPVPGRATDPSPVATTRATYTAGTWTVGHGNDRITPGRYTTDGDHGCSWARHDPHGARTATGDADQATVLTVWALDGAVQFRGDCTWTRETT